MTAFRGMKSLGFRSFLFLGLVLSMGWTAKATVPKRVGTVDDAARSRVVEGVSPRTKVATDLGAAGGERRLGLMSLRFSMTNTQRVALNQLLADQQNPRSARYHQWLTPEKFAAQFGLATTDLQKISGWLSSQGFTVTHVARGGTFVEFSGTVAQANRAFQTEIHTVRVGSETHIANTVSPSLPAAIAAVTTAVMGLDDFTLRPQFSQRVVSAAAQSLTPKPEYNSPTNSNHYLAPGDLYTIYDVNALLTSSVNGSGVTIAVVGQSDINLSDIAAFRSASGLSVNAPTVMVYGADPGMPSSSSATPTQMDFTESTFDVEWVGAMAPSASILFVTSSAVLDGSLTEAIDNNLAPIISDSYSVCESNVGANGLAVYSSTLQMAAAEGITVIAPAGNSGATACDAVGVTSAQNGLAVGFPADSPYVTGVGGTAFNEGSGNYFSSTNGANSGSAIAYIPEVVWNEDAIAGLFASGGGASLYYNKPAWQVGNGVPADFARDVPDVAMAAAQSHDGYLYCTPGFCTNGYAGSSGSQEVVGGTDVSAPVFAGIMGLVVQKQGRVGVANGTIYALANSTYQPSVFHDVVSGNNASPCTKGTPNCTTGSPIGYSAAAGYDQATGWGSVDAFNLVSDWALVSALPSSGGTTGSVTNLTANTASVSAGTNVALTATVSAASGSTTPTGTVQFTVDGVASGTGATLAGGVATYSLPTAGLSSGTHLVQATYSGDGTFAGSKGAFSLDITSSTNPDFKLTPGKATVTVASGGIAPVVSFTVTPLNGFSGNVTFTASASATFAATYSFTTNPVVITTQPGTTTLNLFAYTVKAKNATLQGMNPVGPSFSGWKRVGGGVAMAGLLLLFVPRRRRMGALLIFLVAMGVLGTVGCLSSAPVAATSTRMSTTAGTYTVNIAATATISGTAVTHNSTVTFVVQ